MRRILICVAYDGTGYKGWQFQPGVPTIEGELNKALSALTGEDISVIGASRTDTGVHSLSSMAVFDTNSSIPPEKFADAANTKLPDDVRLVWSGEVPQDFHPRHTETEKTYTYTIYTGRFMPPMYRNYCMHESRPLNVDDMRLASAYLVGEHDFKTFCSADTTALTTVRTVKSIEIEEKEDLLTMSVTGNGFLYNMVRIIVGTLLWVGLGVRKPEEVKTMLEACDRSAAGPTAPACGLLLKEFKFMEGL